MNTEKVTRIDITKLFETPDSVIFNPAIIHLYGDVYFIIFRRFKRYVDINFQEKALNIYNPLHPWAGGANSSTWWKYTTGSDHSEMALISISEQIEIIYKFTETIADEPGVGIIYGQDARGITLNSQQEIFSTQIAKLLLTFNVFKSDKNIILKKSSCSPWCGLMAYAVVIVDLNKKTIEIESLDYICPRISNQVEKNWSLWKLNSGKVYFSYGLSPAHDVYEFIGAQKCSDVFHVKSNFFADLETFYRDVNFQISCSSPGYNLQDDTILAIGHAKFYHSEIAMSKINPTTPLWQFQNFIKSLNVELHPIYIYVMFFYRFESATGKILQFSDMFSIGFDTGLVFPMAIFPVGSLVGISYGDTDSKCIIALFEESTIINNLQNPYRKKEKINFTIESVNDLEIQ